MWLSNITNWTEADWKVLLTNRVLNSNMLGVNDKDNNITAIYIEQNVLFHLFWNSYPECRQTHGVSLWSLYECTCGYYNVSCFTKNKNVPLSKDKITPGINIYPHCDKYLYEPCKDNTYNIYFCTILPQNRQAKGKHPNKKRKPNK